MRHNKISKIRIKRLNIDYEITSMMKLVVFIPAYNEEKSIGEVILKIPRKIPGFDKIEVLVINDGSHDKTVDVE